VRSATASPLRAQYDGDIEARVGIRPFFAETCDIRMIRRGFHCTTARIRASVVCVRMRRVDDESTVGPFDELLENLLSVEISDRASCRLVAIARCQGYASFACGSVGSRAMSPESRTAFHFDDGGAKPDTR